MRWLIIFCSLLCSTPVIAVAADASGQAELEALENPGYQPPPDWFKVSFLDIGEDVAEAAAGGKRVLLYFYQDGCPYCAKLLREGFGDPRISETARAGFEAIAINIWGDRDVTGLDGEETTEKAFARTLGVQYTPTLLLLNEQSQVVLRIDGLYPPHQLHQALRYVAGRQEQTGETFRDFYRSQQPRIAEGALHHEPGFLGTPIRLADRRRESWRPLVVFFEQPVCAGCDELHDDILRRPGIATSLSAFDAAIVDAWSEQPVQAPDGRELSARDWAAELGIRHTPSLVFFDAVGSEVFRTDGALKAFHIHGALDYVATRAYRHQPSFQRYLQERTAALAARGIPVELMD